MKTRSCRCIGGTRYISLHSVEAQGAACFPSALRTVSSTGLTLSTFGTSRTSHQISTFNHELEADGDWEIRAVSVSSSQGKQLKMLG